MIKETRTPNCNGKLQERGRLKYDEVMACSEATTSNLD